MRKSFIKTVVAIKKYRSSRPGVFLRKGVLKICSKFTGEHPCQRNFIEIALRHGCSPVNLLHILKTPFPKNTFGWLLLKVSKNKLKPKYHNHKKYSGRLVTTDRCDHNETLADTKDWLSNITEVILKPIRMNFQISPGYINFLKIRPG